MRLKYKLSEVLSYSTKLPVRNTVARYYKIWREENDLPIRCDNADCFFFKEPLIWNGKEIKPILDHINGNKFDNTHQNLRYLCPNCDSQLETRGGKNKGRVQNSNEIGYEIDHKNRRRDAIVHPPSLKAKAKLINVKVNDA